jgi:hypothetical protein
VQWDQRNPKYSYIGSGFFIGPTGLIATARHNFSDSRFLLNQDDQFCGVVDIFSGSGLAFRRIIAITNHQNADVSIAVTVPADSNLANQVVVNDFLPLTTSIPRVSGAVTLCAYPRTSVIMEGSSHAVSMTPSIYVGKLMAYHEDWSLIIRSPICLTSLIIHPGASGGPVFDEKGRVFGIASSEATHDNGLTYGYVSPIASLFDLTIPLAAILQGR